MNVIKTKYTGTSGIYTSATPSIESVSKIVALLESADYPFSLDKFKDEAHMTIMYCRNEAIDADSVSVEDEIIALPLRFEHWNGHDNNGYIVLKCVSKPASDLHDHILGLGAEHSFSDYTPHITISTDVGTTDVTELIEKLTTLVKSKPVFLVNFDTINIEDCKQK